MTAPLSEDILREALAAVERNDGNLAAAARELNVSRTTLQHQVNEGRRRLLDEVTELTPEGHITKGVSTLYGPDGEVKARWVKSDIDREKALEALRDAIEGMKGEIPRAAPVSASRGFLADLCNLYTFTDFHLGCLAWHREGGADWDLKIAERTLLASMQAMVAQSPKASAAVLNIQGDFLHTDGQIPITPTNHNVLDADSRFPKIRQTAIKLVRALVQMALEAHSQVHLIIAEGNHDPEGAGWLADAFSVLYEGEPRVDVNDCALPFYVFEWGETMIGVHHGHKVKNQDLPLLFAAQFPSEWGRTRRREIHCGHRHHRDEKEYNGVTVIQHPTLAARDAYAARGGWIADRAAYAITYSKRFGQVGRVMVTPEIDLEDPQSDE